MKRESEEFHIRENDEGFKKRKRIEFFSGLALKHIPEMRLLFRGGKLTKPSGWRNVVEHSLVQVAVAETLAENIRLPIKDAEALAKVAACHDWEKRLNKRPQDFTEEERRTTEEFLRKTNPNRILMDATKMEWLRRAVVEGKASFLEKLQFCIDDIIKGSEIVSLDERIDEAEAREGNLGAGPELEAELGGRYRVKERELGHEIEREIFDILKKRGIDIGRPELLPNFLRARIEEKIGPSE